MVSSRGLFARNKRSCYSAPQVNHPSPSYTPVMRHSDITIPSDKVNMHSFVFFPRCNIAVILLTDLIVDHGVKVEWSAYIHLLLHAIFIGISCPTLNLLDAHTSKTHIFIFCPYADICVVRIETAADFSLQVADKDPQLCEGSLTMFLCPSSLQVLITSIRKSTNTAGDCCFTCLLSKEQTAMFSPWPWCFYATETTTSHESSLQSRHPQNSTSQVGSAG